MGPDSCENESWPWGVSNRRLSSKGTEGTVCASDSSSSSSFAMSIMSQKNEEGGSSCTACAVAGRFLARPGPVPLAPAHPCHDGPGAPVDYDVLPLANRDLPLAQPGQETAAPEPCQCQHWESGMTFELSLHHDSGPGGAVSGEGGA